MLHQRAGELRRRVVVVTAGILLSAGPLRAQSLLDRPPNLSGAWIPPQGVIQFNFSHRFSRSPAPERKITGYPSFTAGAGLLQRVAAGFVYSTNSALVPRYPNEWELFARGLVVAQRAGAPADLGLQASYNLATEGVDAELSLARRWARVTAIGVLRSLSAVDSAEDREFALGGGMTARLTSHVALAGDAVSLLGAGVPEGRRVAWSAGLNLAIPGTPHTLSLHATNAAGTTLQSATSSVGETRYGFEFTIPITLARYFGRRTQGRIERAGAATDTVRVSINGLAFQLAALEVRAGTTVVWVNDDPVDHSVVAADGVFDSGLIPPGRRWSRTFATPGEVEYACGPHPFMRGRIVVTENR